MEYVGIGYFSYFWWVLLVKMLMWTGNFDARSHICHAFLSFYPKCGLAVLKSWLKACFQSGSLLYFVTF